MTLNVRICIGLSLTMKSGPLSTEQALTLVLENEKDKTL